MTQTITSNTSLYDRDLNLWLETVIAQLKSGDFQNLDVENLIEELEGLAGRDKRELKSRLRTLIEHLLKRMYVNMPDCYNRWKNVIREQRSQLGDIIDSSPSLKAIWDETFNNALASALKNVRDEYPQQKFSDTWQFSRDIDAMLNIKFW